MPGSQVQPSNMENRQSAIVGPEVIFAILSGTFVFWRIFNNAVMKGMLKLADILIFMALISNLIALACSSTSTHYGLGRHIYDPSVTPEGLVKCLRLIWVAELTNLVSMLFAKLSIGAFLLYFDFSRGYKVLVWSTVGIVIVCNGVVSLTSIIGSCDPIALNWDMRIPGKCWEPIVSKICVYIQSSSNIVTDVIFVSLPIYYLSSIKLRSTVQWGLRIVLMFGLIATICSIMKIAVTKRMFTTKDPTWDAVDLSIWATAEVNVCIIAACLPPLRSQFDAFLRRCFGLSCSRPITRDLAPYKSASRPKDSSVDKESMGAMTHEVSNDRSFLSPEDVENEHGSPSVGDTSQTHLAPEGKGPKSPSSC